MNSLDYENFKKMYLKGLKKTYKNGSKEQRKILRKEVEEHPRLSTMQKNAILKALKGTKKVHNRTKKVLGYSLSNEIEMFPNKAKNEQ